MSWFWFSIIALLCWSGSDFFSKIGCRDASDKYSQYKMVTAVGVVMGIHAAFEVFVGGVEISWQVIWTYLPVSLLYIGSMTLGRQAAVLQATAPLKRSIAILQVPVMQMPCPFLPLVKASPLQWQPLKTMP